MSPWSRLRPLWTSLRRSPAFTIAAALTLVLGIGAAVAIFALVNGVLLRPLPYGDPDRLVGAWHNLPGVHLDKANQTTATYRTYQRFARTIEGIALYRGDAVNVADPRGGSAPQRLRAAVMSANALSVLKVSPLLGRGFTEAEDVAKGPEVVLIGEGLWRSRFGGDRHVVGRTLEINGRTHEIIGVMPERFRFPDATVQLWRPNRLEPNPPYAGGFSWNAVARLKPGVTLDAAQRDFASVLPRVAEVSPLVAPGVPTQMLLEQAKPSPLLVPLKEDVVGGIARTLWIVAGAALLVLLVACANVTNLILVRADARQRELAVREALGAGRSRVLGYFLSESLAITALAAITGLALAAVAIRALVAAGPADIPRLAEVRVDAATVAFTIVVSLVVAFVCSLAPALRIGRADLSNTLREGGRGGTAGRVRQRMRSALVAAQIALALVALAGSGLLVRTFLELNAVRPGFDAAGVQTFWMSPTGAKYPNDSSVSRFYGQLLDRVRALPGVRAAGITSRVPLAQHGMDQDPFYPEDDPSYATRIPPLQLYTSVDGGYFQAMGIPLLTGRTFDPLDRQRSNEAVISQATAIQFWRDSTGRSVIGKRFRSLPGGSWYTVIGVVGSVRDTALAAPPGQAVYFPEVPAAANDLDGQLRGTMALVVRTACASDACDAGAITSAVERTVHELDPGLPLFDTQSMARVLDASTAQLSFTILVLGIAAGVTLVLGAVGLYGVMAYVVALRTRELGVRIALGATPREISGMLMKQGGLLTASGIAIGLALFAIVARSMRALLFGVAPGDPATLAGAALLLLAVAMLASWFPARRTARLHPADVLRAD